MDLILRRRAIYTGMRPYFEDEALLDALMLWQEKYSERPKYAFTEFLSVCCKTKELRQQRSNILSSIFKALDLPESDLLDDPFGELNSGNVKTSQSSINLEVNDVTRVFKKFFEVLMSKVREKEALAIKALLIKNMAKLDLDSRRKVILQEWLESKRETLECGYSLNEIRIIVNFSYVAMCEYFGPVKSDQILAQAINTTEPSARELGVNLHDFL
jgi:hypothetical protein